MPALQGAQRLLFNHLIKDPWVFVQFEYISFRKFYKVGNLTSVVSTGRLYNWGEDGKMCISLKLTKNKKIKKKMPV